MTPKEHFCHSRLVVPAQTSKAREGTHHLLVVRFLKEGSTGPPSPPPSSMVFSKPFGDPTYQTSPPCTRELFDQNHHKNKRGCVMIVSWYVSCLSKTHVLCWDLPRIPPKKKHCRAEELLRVLGVATSVTTSLKAKGACSTGLFTSAATKYENESNGQNGRKALWNHIEINDFPVGLKKTTCWKFSVKESNIINVWILNKNCEISWVEASTLRSRSPLKWLLHQRRVMSSFHEHPHEGCSRSLLHGKFLTFFWGLETHGGNIERMLRKDTVNSMSEGQQPLSGPFLRHFLGNPEVRSDQNKKTCPLAVLWPRIPRFAAASHLTGLSKLQSDSPDHKILTELTPNIISKYTYSLHITWLNHNIFIYKLCIWWDMIGRYRQYTYCLGLIPVWGITWSRIIAVACFSEKLLPSHTPLTYIPVLSCRISMELDRKTRHQLRFLILSNRNQTTSKTLTFQMWQKLLQQSWCDSLEERLAGKMWKIFPWVAHCEKLPPFLVVNLLVVQKENITTLAQFYKNIACKWWCLLSNLKKWWYSLDYFLWGSQKISRVTQANNPP